MPSLKGIVAVFVLSFLLVSAGLAGSAFAEHPTIRIGSKSFTEQWIVGELLAQLLEANGYKVDRKLGLGGTKVVHEALVNNQIDLYAEYTGTGLVTILREPVMTDPQAVYDKVKRLYQKRWNLVWLQPIGFNNTYALSMRRDAAERLRVTTISDLARVAAHLVLGATHEFLNRDDGYPGLKRVYGLEFKRTVSLDPGLMYQAVAHGQVDVISAFATDGRIRAFQLVNLDDDKQFFPPYFIAPVIRGDLLAKHPKIGNVLNRLAGRIDNATMQALNYEVDGKGREPRDVAAAFLRKTGLIK